ncbi:MAG: thiaminase II [Bradymonadales bacterium]|nr:thiaminase II [Bradymonadales bacterium]
MISSDLYQAAQDLWQAQREHPFVQGIAEGTIADKQLACYVLQDYRYLVEYARVLALAAARADRLESMTWFSQVLHLTLGTEMELHRRFASRLSISAEELESAPLLPTTRAYADFLVRTAAIGDLVDLVAALLPCTWGYVELAEELASRDLPDDPFCAEWIRQYSGPEFKVAADWLVAELDRLAAGASEQKRAVLEELFVTSSRYELAFWEMCWQGR